MPTYFFSEEFHSKSKYPYKMLSSRSSGLSYWSQILLIRVPAFPPACLAYINFETVSLHIHVLTEGQRAVCSDKIIYYAMFLRQIVLSIAFIWYSDFISLITPDPYFTTPNGI